MNLNYIAFKMKPNLITSARCIFLSQNFFSKREFNSKFFFIGMFKIEKRNQNGMSHFDTFLEVSFHPLKK